MKIHPCNEVAKEVKKVEEGVDHHTALGDHGIYKIVRSTLSGRLVVFSTGECFWKNSSNDEITSAKGWVDRYHYVKTNEKLCLEIK